MAGVRLDNLTKKFGDTVAVKAVSLDVKPGELFFLLGPSGCGKSTLLRAIAGFNEPEEGRVYFDGRDMTRVPAHRRNTGMVFQNYALWPHMTVEANVAYGLEVRKVPRAEQAKRVRDTLAIVQMEEYAARRPNQLSGGQQQRIALARALVVQPEVILLDEPLSNLDAKLRLEMRDEIRRIHRETRITTIYVTHDQKEALSMADRMAVMNFGQVQQVGTPVEVYRRPVSPFVAGFIGETNLFDGTVLHHNNGSVVIGTAAGEIQAADSRNLEGGKKVQCSVRPEALIILTGESPAEGVTIEAKVAHSTYLGEIVQYGLKAGNGGQLRATELNPENPPAPGTKVKLFIPRNEVSLFG